VLAAKFRGGLSAPTQLAPVQPGIIPPDIGFRERFATGRDRTRRASSEPFRAFRPVVAANDSLHNTMHRELIFVMKIIIWIQILHPNFSPCRIAAR
jgi:hypothetical protein